MSNSAQIDYPVGLPYGTVTGRFALGYADGTDTNTVPDLMPAKATRVVFTPSVNKIVFVGKNGPITIFPQPVECTIDEQGYLTGPDETPGVILLATTAAGMDPDEWSWTVTFHNPAVAGFSFQLGGGQSLDLATVMPVADTPGTVTVVSEETAAQVQATLAKLDALIASSQVTAPNLQRHFYEQKVYVPSENVWLFGDREAPEGAVDWGTSWASAQGTWDESEKAWRLPAGSIRLAQMSHYAPMPVLPGQAYVIELDIKPDNAGQHAHFTVYDTGGGSKTLLSLHDLDAGWHQYKFDYTTEAPALDRFVLFFQHATGTADGGAWFRIRVYRTLAP